MNLRGGTGKLPAKSRRLHVTERLVSTTATLLSRSAAQLLQKPYPPKDLAKKIRDILDSCGAKNRSA